MAENQKMKNPDKRGKKKPEDNYNCPLACDPSDEARRFAETKAKLRSGHADQPNYEPWLKSYEFHLKALDEVQPVIDCHDPMVARDEYVQIKNYNLRGKEFERIATENAILLRRIADIFCDGSRIDNQRDYSIKPMDHRGIMRERKGMNTLHENYNIINRLNKVKPYISRNEQLKWYAQMEKHMERRSLYPLHFKPLPCTKAYQNIIHGAHKNPKQYAYLQVEMEDKMVTNLICELYANLCPFTAMNFQKLCTNSSDECKCRSYRCKKVEKLVSIPRPNGEYERAYWQVGTTVDAMPQYIQYMNKEDSPLKHTKVGYLTRPKGVATGEFYITPGPAPYLDGLCYIFGRVVGPGMPFLNKMQETNIDTQGNPKVTIHITDCGVASSPDKVPRSMLMSHFIRQVKEQIIPFVAKTTEDEDSPK